jgi:hypothetical protein
MEGESELKLICDCIVELREVRLLGRLLLDFGIADIDAGIELLFMSLQVEKYKCEIVV